MKRLFIFSCLVSFFSLAIHFVDPPILRYLEEDIVDLKFQLRGQRPVPPQVVMITVGQKDLEAYGLWPWKRNLVGSVIQKIHDAGAEVIVLDMVMSAPEKEDEFLSGILKGKRAVLGYCFQDEPTSTSSGRKIDPSFKLRELALDLKTASTDVLDVEFLPRFAQVETSSPTLSASAAHQGFFTIFPDRDGTIRRCQLIAILNGYAVPFIGLAGVELMKGQRASSVVDRLGVISLRVGDLDLPVAPDGSIRINFYGPESTVRQVGVTDIMEGNHDLSGKIAFLGVTEKVVGDFKSTPTSPLMPGTEILATIAANIVTRDFPVENVRTKLVALFLMILLPALVAVAEIRLSPFRSTVFCAVLLAGFLVANLAVFLRWTVIIDSFLPVFALVFAFVGNRGYKVLVLERNTRHIRKCFQAYVSKEVLDMISTDSECLNLGGEEKIITCLFSDIWGFTRLSERLSPTEVVGMLNNTLGPLSEIIMNQYGMVDKFIGDAIMGIFNAPFEIEDHADRAVTAAIQMANLIEDMENVQGVRIGVGIHSGLAVVGNMGTQRKMNYTALGDTVNLASRIEGLTREVAAYILISQHTKDMLKEIYPIRMLDDVAVKGREEPAVIYQVFHKEPARDLIEIYEEGLNSYHDGNRREAERAFSFLCKQYGDVASDYFLKKMEKCLK
jgi:adenylate cyclase